jgi:drug/metabolite transporter (DMT)-like permease
MYQFSIIYLLTRTSFAAVAFASAIVYGIYIVVMKKKVGNEDRVNMPLFFGLVGFFNLVFLWPGLFILHFTGVESFALPPTGKVWMIVLVSVPLQIMLLANSGKVNAILSLVSDFAWVSRSLDQHFLSFVIPPIS